MVILAQKEKQIKLDAIDKKILRYLITDYRIQRKKLAKLVNISPQRLNHRIKQLEKNLIEPYICLNYPLLNIDSYLLLYDSLDEEEIKSISESGNAYYLLKLIGETQYLAIILTENIVKFCGKHTPNLKPKIFPLTTFFPDNWNGYEIQTTPSRNIPLKNYVPTSEDYKILEILCENPRVSPLDISKKLKMNRQNITKRIRLLEESRIIQKYGISINIPKMGFLTYFVHLTCLPNQIDKIINQIRNNVYSGFLFQSYNHLFFSYIVPDHESLFGFLELIKNQTNASINVFQNTGNYLVDPTPDYAKKILLQKI